MAEETQGSYFAGEMAASYSFAGYRLARNCKPGSIGATLATFPHFNWLSAVLTGRIDPFILVAMVATGVIAAVTCRVALMRRAVQSLI